LLSLASSSRREAINSRNPRNRTPCRKQTPWRSGRTEA
jgi:hypothetical protein